MRSEYKWIAGIVIILAASGLFVLLRQDKDVKISDEPTPTTIDQSIVVEGSGQNDVVSPGKATATVEYTQLVKDYEGRRIQFGMDCQAVPANVTYKNNTKVMFDNRSGDARVITIGGVKYNFAGYGYKILNITGRNLPATISYNCGAGVNVGTILIQN